MSERLSFVINKIRVILFVCLFSGLSADLKAQTSEVFDLWPNGAKESNGIKAVETTDAQGRISNISIAQFTVYKVVPEKNTGIAVVICPGGGYEIVAKKHEGDLFAEWLAERGITGIVLKYRLPNRHHAVPLSDVQRCIQIVRCRAEEFKIDPDKIGVAGFSAGGHLASTAGTHFTGGNSMSKDRFERFSNRPDFMILFYPVISFTDMLTHKGSRSALIGTGGSQALIDFYSNEKHVTSKTPPTFLLHCDDDNVVTPLNSVVFYQSLKNKKVPAALYILPKGGHGWGLNSDYMYYQQWTELLDSWLKEMAVRKA